MHKNFTTILREAIERNTTSISVEDSPLIKPIAYFFWPMLSSTYSRSGNIKQFLSSNKKDKTYFHALWQTASIQEKSSFIHDFLLGEFHSNLQSLYEANLHKVNINDVSFIKNLHEMIPSYIFDIIVDIGNSTDFSNFDNSLNRNLLVIKLYQKTIMQEDPCERISHIEKLIKHLDIFDKIKYQKVVDENLSDESKSIIEIISQDFDGKTGGNEYSFYSGGLGYDYKNTVSFWLDVNRLLHKKPDTFDSAWERIERSKGFLDKRREVINDNAKYCECLTEKIFNAVRDQGFDSLKEDSCHALLSKSNPSEKAFFQVSVLFSGIKDAKHINLNLSRKVAQNISSLGPLVMPNLSASGDRTVRTILETYFDSVRDK